MANLIWIVIGVYLVHLIGLAIFLAGYFYGKKRATRNKNTVPTIVDEYAQKEIEIQKQRDTAFKQMMNYNINTAYGITKDTNKM